MSNIDITKMQSIINDFANERDWKQFHTPKNISMALNIEASELMEIFQWLTPEESCLITKDPMKKACVEDEISDVFIYLLRMADLLKIDIEKSVMNKIKKNALKYPIDKSKGNSKKYNEL